MNAAGLGLSRIKGGSAPSNITVRPRLFSVRSARRVARIVALGICFLTFVQLASAFSNTAACPSPRATLYRFTHFPFEEVGSKAPVASSLSALQCARFQVRVAPQPLPPRASMVFCALVQSQQITPVRLKVPPSSSDDDH